MVGRDGGLLRDIQEPRGMLFHVMLCYVTSNYIIIYHIILWYIILYYISFIIYWCYIMLSHSVLYCCILCYIIFIIRTMSYYIILTYLSQHMCACISLSLSLSLYIYINMYIQMSLSLSLFLTLSLSLYIYIYMHTYTCYYTCSYIVELHKRANRWGARLREGMETKARVPWSSQSFQGFWVGNQSPME